jgi:hypothetical protein
VFVLGQVHDFCPFFSAMTMTKRAFIAGVAALFLATGAVHAVEQWSLNTHRCDVSASSGSGIFDLEDVLALQKLIPLLKKCDAFYECAAKRDYPKGFDVGAPDPLKPGEKRPKHCFWPRELGKEP